jgi:hypothetical protein
MGRNRSGRGAVIATAVLLLAAVPAGAASRQQKDAPADEGSAHKSNSAGQQSDTVTIHIEVTAGEKDKPVEAASIYVRYSEPRKLRHAQKVEMNVKTTPQGKARVPYVPRGTVLIQVIAEGWKTFGKNFEITEDEQVIKIHLDRPHQWY